MAAHLDIRRERTADTVMLLALTLARRGSDGAPAARPAALAGRTLGLIGLGPIGEAVARRASLGFGMQVLVQSTSRLDRAIAARHGAAWTSSMDQLLTASDLVSLQVQVDAETPVIDARRLNQMKPEAHLINTLHGRAVDEKALLHALWFETIGGAGICVEPHTLERPGDLDACDNAVILPHPGPITDGSMTMPAFAAMAPAMGNVVQLFADDRQRA